jgi:hypothetical protein
MEGENRRWRVSEFLCVELCWKVMSPTSLLWYTHNPEETLSVSY